MMPWVCPPAAGKSKPQRQCQPGALGRHSLLSLFKLDPCAMITPTFKRLILAALTMASGADAQAIITPGQLAAFTACGASMDANCASKDASCTATLLANVASGTVTQDQVTKVVVAAGVCKTTFTAAVAKFEPSKRRLSDSIMCPSDCQDTMNCQYKQIMLCLKKIDGLPSAITDAYGTYISCSAKSQKCALPFACPSEQLSHLIIRASCRRLSVPDECLILLAGCSCYDPGSFIHSTAFIIWIAVAAAVVVVLAVVASGRNTNSGELRRILLPPPPECTRRCCWPVGDYSIV